ncbi:MULTISPECIES: hypothetical protein [unclassified Phyllobacterium]|uniref:hypothetical protein n=1 Tax=unclassified Phyllobacterium TaxID=2638441 RepID=UPI003012FE74
MFNFRNDVFQLNVVLSAILLVSSSNGHADNAHLMKSDVTIYLDGLLLNRGGTVFVVPREIPVDEWEPQPDQPNPSRSDSRLDVRKPISERDRRLSVLAFGQVSIVRFDYPAGGSYDFRFLPSLESGIPPEKQGSALVEAGNTYDYHPKTREEMFVPVVQVFSILGPDADESESRSLGSEVKLGYLEERYNCKEFEGSLSCVVRERK